MQTKEESKLNRIIGKKAPNFHLKAVSGDRESFSDVSLDTYKGHWLVLSFYPMDFVFVCLTEIATFNDDLCLFDETDAKLLTVSADSKYTHQAWICNGPGRVGYPLRTDKTLSMATDYGVLPEDQGVALCGLLIIDPDQTIRHSMIHDNNIGGNTREVLQILKALQTGSLYGVNWTIRSQPLKEDRPSPPDSFTSNKTARIYTLPDCSYRRQVREFFVDNGAPYEEVGLDSDMQG